MTPLTGRPAPWRRVARFLRRLGPAGPLAVVATALPPLGAVLLLGLVAVYAPGLRDAPGAPVAVAVAFMVLGGSSVLPTYAVSILAGWAFGFAVGFPAALAGIVGASLVGYAIARRASGGRLLAIIDEKPSWRAVHGALLAGGFGRAVWIIVLLRMAPLPPFALTNLVMGAAHVRVSRFALGTLVGMAPQAGLLSLTADGLHEMSFGGAGGEAGTRRWAVAVSVAAMVVVVLVIGRLARRALDAATRTAENPAP